MRRHSASARAARRAGSTSRPARAAAAVGRRRRATRAPRTAPQAGRAMPHRRAVPRGGSAPAAARCRRPARPRPGAGCDPPRPADPAARPARRRRSAAEPIARRRRLRFLQQLPCLGERAPRRQRLRLEDDQLRRVRLHGAGTLQRGINRAPVPLRFGQPAIALQQCPAQHGPQLARRVGRCLHQLELAHRVVDAVILQSAAPNPMRAAFHVGSACTAWRNAVSSCTRSPVW